MNIIIFGGQGRTGRLVALEALRQGHHVSVFALRDGHILPKDIHIIEGDARNAGQVAAAIRGHDAVINIIAPKLFDRKNYDISEVATRHIIAGMKQHGVHRYIGQSGAWATEFMTDASLPMRLGFLVIPMFRGIYGYKKREDAIVKQSDLDWTLVRCGILRDTVKQESIHVIADGRYKCKPLEIPMISRKSVAVFHIEILDSPTTYHTTPVILATA